MNRIIKDHFLNPRNMGALDGPDYEATVRSDICNDIVKMMIRTDDSGCIENIKTQVYGCGYAIAGSSIFTEAAQGRRMEEVLETAERALAKLSKDIPSQHLSCIRLARKAYRKIYEKHSTESGNGTS